MTNISNFARKALRGGTALQALALMGAGVAALGVSTSAFAQDYNQVQATGRVQGTDGKPVVGATVTLTSNAQGVTRTVTTDSSGNFRAPALQQGTYTFTIEAPGYDTFTDNTVSLTQSGAANQFTLAATGAGSDEIVVTAGRVQTVDFDRNSTGAVINVADLASRVPVARDITSVALLSPGTTAGDTAFGSLPAINGASVSENIYYVNGLNITQFRNGLGAVTVPFDFYQSVEIKNGGFPAEYGRTTGGVLNATTKSGSNEFHGGITFNWEPNSLREQAPNTYLSDNDSTYNERREMIAQLSGPIIKDHLFFYGLYNSRSIRSGGGTTSLASNQPIAGTPTAAQQSQSCFYNPAACAVFNPLTSANQALQGTGYTKNAVSSPFYGGKIDAVIVDGQRLEATYFNTSNIQTTNTFGLAANTLASGNRYNPNTNNPGAYASSTTSKGGGENYVFRYTGTFTNWLTLSAAYGVNKNRDTTESSTPDYPSIVDSRGGSNVSVGNPNGNTTLNFDKRTFYRADADLNFKLLGTHHIRGGYDREDLDLNTAITASGGFQYTYAIAGGVNSTIGGIDGVTGLPNRTPYATGRTFTSGGQFATRNEAYYIQDSWSLLENRLQFNLGIRNDRFVSRNADGVSFFSSGNQWGPRLGASFDPTGDGRTRFYGSFSRYFLPVAVNTNVRLAGSELDQDVYNVLNGTNADNTPILGAPVNTVPGGVACVGAPAGAGATNCIVRNDGTVPSTGSTVASNLKPQSTDEIIIGGETRIGSRIKIGAFFTYTKLNDSLEDASLDQAIVPYCVAQGKALAACRGIWSGVHQYALINPGRDVVVQLSDPLPGETNIRTATLSAADLQYPQASRKYRAMSFTFDREFDGKWDLHANYTYSKLIGNIEGGIRSDNGQTDSGLTTAFDLPSLVTGTYGYLPNDRRHNFKVYGSYKLSDVLQFGANLSASSPRRFGCYGRAPSSIDFNATQTGGITGPNYGANAAYCNLDANGNVVSNPVGFTTINDPFNRPGGVRPTTLGLTPRGSQFKSDWLVNLNVDVAIKVPTDAFDGTFRVSVFNVLNLHQKLDFQEFGTVAAGTPNIPYGQVTNYQAPRFIRLQFGVNF